MDLGERQAELRAQVPTVREAHRSGTEHEPTVPFDHQHEILGHEARRRVERMKIGVEHDLAVPLGPTRAGGARRAPTATCSRLVLDPVERGEHGGPVRRVQATLVGDRRVGIGTEFDPVVQVERSHAEPPPERLLVEFARALEERQVTGIHRRDHGSRHY